MPTISGDFEAKVAWHIDPQHNAVYLEKSTFTIWRQVPLLCLTQH